MCIDKVTINFYAKKTITGIILLAGNSTRYGANNKNLEILANEKTVLSYSLDAFNINENISNIILVVRKEDIKTIKGIVNLAKLSKKVKFVIGGSTRKESVCNALKETNCDIVVIHDAARPLIKQEYLNDCIKYMDEYKGVSIAVKTKDTIKITNDNNEVVGTTERCNTWLVQTPQCFDRITLLNAHLKYDELVNITDDCMLLEKDNYQIKLIEGDYANIKITTPEDIIIAREYLKRLKGNNL